MYIGLLALSRFFLRREAGTGSLSDLLVVVLLADASQNAMAGSYTTITDGLLLVTVILFWSFVVDWLSFHFKSLEWIAHPAPMLLVKHGKILRRNMRKELITEEELWSALHADGVENLMQVKKVRIEGDGKITVIKR